jgi:hypothetical protein
MVNLVQLLPVPTVDDGTSLTYISQVHLYDSSITNGSLCLLLINRKITLWDVGARLVAVCGIITEVALAASFIRAANEGESVNTGLVLFTLFYLCKSSLAHRIRPSPMVG